MEIIKTTSFHRLQATGYQEVITAGLNNGCKATIISLKRLQFNQNR